MSGDAGPLFNLAHFCTTMAHPEITLFDLPAGLVAGVGNPIVASLHCTLFRAYCRERQEGVHCPVPSIVLRPAIHLVYATYIHVAVLRGVVEGLFVAPGAAPLEPELLLARLTHAPELRPIQTRTQEEHRAPTQLTPYERLLMESRVIGRQGPARNRQ